ncbi:FKBP-type peptidyl-prolyl cis-trans isomerase [Massilia oculi]|uniref:Peptidyl-prolyl cis-trans isomerase n=1 Tax=Massilia hydrophila TaxID=3044279 RepID=A0ABS7YAW4_9BURK|nr:FKBP-type peptidyl-prolyl cis-trans isomerase [Massilia oculi]MCA1856847.1 FKBP-type peptidyl-prolyl cis-trans isomerase [Massilia oculi]
MIRRTAFAALVLAAAPLSCALASATAQDSAAQQQDASKPTSQPAPEQQNVPQATQPQAAPQAAPGVQVAPAPQVEIIDRVVGKGREATPGNTVFVHYTGWLHKPLAPKQRGKKFDSSLDRGEPLEFQLGAGRVIKGWEQGVAGMKVGGKRTLVIPSALGYGPRGAGGMIPPDADLIFDVELVNVK